MERKGLELNTSNKKLFKLDFDRSPQSIYPQSNTKVISNLRTRRSSAKKAQLENIDLRIFSEKLPL